MAHTANHSIPEPGIVRRALATASAVLQSLDNSSLDYTLDRIESLEREVRRLRDELRQNRGPAANTTGT